MRSATSLSTCVLLIVASCATTPTQPAVEPALSKAEVEDVDAGAQDAADACAAQGEEGGEPVPMGARDRGTGVVPADVVAQLNGTHVVSLVWEPWWAAAPIENGPLGALTVEIEMLGTARDQGGDLALDAKVRLHDAKRVLALERRVTFLVHDRLLVFANLEIDDPALAKRLGLPKALASKIADPFELVLSLRDGALLVWVASTRSGNRCALAHGAKPARNECEQRFGDRVMAETAILQPRSLREPLAPGFAPQDALQELAQQQLNVRWPDGKRARLHVDYEAEERVCVTEEEGYRIVIPLHAVLRSEDGRLDARFSGFAETSVARDGTWDRVVEAELEETRVRPPGRDERTGFDVPEGSTALLYTSLRTPNTGGPDLPGLMMRVCQPFEGAPPYPAKVDDARRRMGCFCESERHVQPASIWRTPPDEAKPLRLAR